MIDGETGLVIRAGNKQDLVTSIKAIIVDHETVSRMGENARLFTINKAPDRSETYSTILNAGASQSSCDQRQVFL